MSSYTTNLPAVRDRAAAAAGPTLAERIEYAKTLADAELLPVQYRRRPANVLVAIDTGEMLGIPAMAALNNIHVIEGTPTYSAALMAALVRRAGHKLRVTGDDERAVVTLTRRDDPEFTFKSEWTVNRAVRAGLVKLKDGQPFARDKHGNPLPWERYTASLLKARATSEVCRDGCPDVFIGPAYVPEELGAVVDAEGTPVEATAEVATAEPLPQPAEDTPPPVPSAAHAASGPEADIDWDAAITSADGDTEALAQLWLASFQHHAPDPVKQRVAEAAITAATGDPEALGNLWRIGAGTAAPPVVMNQIAEAGTAARQGTNTTAQEPPQTPAREALGELADEVAARHAGLPLGQSADDEPDQPVGHVPDQWDQLADEAADAEDADAAQCAGVGYEPDGDMTISDQGSEYGTCPGCLTWQPVDPQGHIALHVRADGQPVGER